MHNDNEAIVIDELAALIDSALATADGLRLWDVSIGLDRARVALARIRAQWERPLDEAAPAAPTPRAG